MTTRRRPRASKISCCRRRKSLTSRASASSNGTIRLTSRYRGSSSQRLRRHRTPSRHLKTPASKPALARDSLPPRASRTRVRALRKTSSSSAPTTSAREALDYVHKEALKQPCFAVCSVDAKEFAVAGNPRRERRSSNSAEGTAARCSSSVRGLRHRVHHRSAPLPGKRWWWAWTGQEEPGGQRGQSTVRPQRQERRFVLADSLLRAAYALRA